jgi:xanthine dehydrogenase accessory factor
MDIFIEPLLDLIRQNRKAVVAVIIDCQGSTPRMAGTRMLVAENGHTFGTIGGGLLEARVIQAAGEMHQGPPTRLLTFDLTNEDAAVMEMICGGRVRVLLYRILPTKENEALFCRWRDAADRGERMAMITASAVGDDSPGAVFQALMCNGDIIMGHLPLSSDIREKLAKEIAGPGGIRVRTEEDLLLVIDAGEHRPTLYLFGAGHVARPTAELAAISGFRVEVFDDRPEFLKSDRFPGASAVHILDGFNRAMAGLSLDTSAYIVIVTRGHLHDKTVLSQALDTGAGYIGMIGSQRKRDTIYSQLQKEGVADADLARVHCPIGLDIGAQTPEEIAVSIVAEMISVRRGN